MKKKIMIVEDDPLTNCFYQQLFKKTDYEVIYLEEGNKIIDSVKNDEFSLIILDINLKNTYYNNKKTDGVNLSQLIKKIDGCSDVPVLLVTAYQKSQGSVNLLKESLADDYIVKPISDFNIFLDKVNKLAS